MAIYAIGDLHLSLSGNKPMDIFGQRWENHVEKLIRGFSAVRDEDTVVLCGDLSWGMTLEEAREDFRFINSLPGKKIIVKGNHDYWWTTLSKMREFFSANGFSTLEIMNNSSFLAEGISVCGTRGWFFEEESGAEHDRKILMREVGRLKASLASAESPKKAVFLHYPPIYGSYRCEEIIRVIREAGVRHCYYGHIHGKGIASAFSGWDNGTEYRLISADFLNFIPAEVEVF